MVACVRLDLDCGAGLVLPVVQVVSCRHGKIWLDQPGSAVCAAAGEVGVGDEELEDS